MKIWLGGKKGKCVLLFDIDEDAIVLASARLKDWVKKRRKQTGKKPTQKAQAQYAKREYHKIVKEKA